MQFLVIIYITSLFNFMKKKSNSLLVQFWSIIHTTTEFIFMKIINTLLAQCLEIIYITSELDFCQNLQI